MKFVPIRDLRVKPGAVWKLLRQEHDLVLTSNGRPFAVLTGVDGDTLEDTLKALRQARFRRVLADIHRTAIEKGLDKITPDQVNEEIAAYRATRRKRRAG